MVQALPCLVCLHGAKTGMTPAVNKEHLWSLLALQFLKRKASSTSTLMLEGTRCFRTRALPACYLISNSSHMQMAMAGKEQGMHIFPGSNCFHLRGSLKAVIISVHLEQSSNSISPLIFRLSSPILLASITAFRETIYRFAIENWHEESSLFADQVLGS